MFFMFNLCTVQTLSGICLTLSVLTYALRCLVSCVFLLYYMYFNIFVTSESIYIVMIVMKKIPFNDVCYQGPCKGCGPWHAKGFSWFTITSIHSIRNRKSETKWKVTEDSRLNESEIRLISKKVWGKRKEKLFKILPTSPFILATTNLTVCYYHVTYEFQSESKLYSLPECQLTPCSKQAPYLKFNWQQWDWNPQPLSS